MLVLTLAQPEVCDESLSNPGGVPTGATLHSKLVRVMVMVRVRARVRARVRVRVRLG